MFRSFPENAKNRHLHIMRVPLFCAHFQRRAKVFFVLFFWGSSARLCKYCSARNISFANNVRNQTLQGPWAAISRTRFSSKESEFSIRWPWISRWRPLLGLSRRSDVSLDAPLSPCRQTWFCIKTHLCLLQKWLRNICSNARVSNLSGYRSCMIFSRGNMISV